MESRYEIQETYFGYARKFRVLDVVEHRFAKGRFNSQQEAQEWINTQESKALLRILSGTGIMMSGRARAYLITDPDYYGSNERSIQAAVR